MASPAACQRPLFNMGLFVYNTYVFRNPYRHPQPAMQNQLSFLNMTKNDK